MAKGKQHSGTQATRYNLYGRPLQLVNQLKELTEKLWRDWTSRRAWGRTVAKLVHQVATTGVDLSHLKGWIDQWVIDAVDRERKLIFLGQSSVVC